MEKIKTDYRRRNLKHVGINFPRTRDLAVLTNKLQD